jgi:hypothetical protein
LRVLESELRIGVKQKAVSNRKQTVVGIQGWVRAWNWSPVSNVQWQHCRPARNLAQDLAGAQAGVLIGMARARFIPGDKF